MYKTAASRS